MSNKPYIEYEGTTYEFEASFSLKRDFEREKQTEVRKALIKSGISEENYEEFKKLDDFISKNKEKGLSALDDKQKEMLSQMFDLLEDISLNTLYDKYCFKMLEKKYNITKEEFDLMLESIAEDYGIEFVDTFVQKVCDKVFTRVVEKKENKKPLPSWID